MTESYFDFIEREARQAEREERRERECRFVPKPGVPKLPCPYCHNYICTCILGGTDAQDIPS